MCTSFVVCNLQNGTVSRITDDLPTRLTKHNAGEVSHTSKYAPWRIKTYIAFSDEKQAFAFETYLKSAPGRAFAKKRL
jgi:predicted GIY-YIG superfamily endonuclease